MKIKESQLRELFKEVGLSEDIFDIFRSKRKKLDRKIKDLKSDLKDMEKTFTASMELRHFLLLLNLPHVNHLQEHVFQ